MPAELCCHDIAAVMHKSGKASDYAAMQKIHYETTSHLMIENHQFHNDNPDYMAILLKPIFGMEGGFALDFGCGHGRNVQSLLAEDVFDRVDGVDISASNIEYATKNILKDGFSSSKFNMMVNNGLDVSVLPRNEYSFVMSTIVLQHICCHSIRFKLFEGLYASMKLGGVLSFQMGFGNTRAKTAGYFDNDYGAVETNSLHDVQVESEDMIIGDLFAIGFNEENITTNIRPSFRDHHEQWIYVQASKE